MNLTKFAKSKIASKNKKKGAINENRCQKSEKRCENPCEPLNAKPLQKTSADKRRAEVLFCSKVLL